MANPPLAFFHLVLACSMSVEEAAQRYGRSKRTIRRWCD
jgi:transposase